MQAAMLCASAWLLCGCLPQLIPEAAPPPATFDFGPPPDERAAPLAVHVYLASVSAPTWLETTRIHYRRLDEQPSALRAYARNEWIAPLSELFAERLSRRLMLAAPAGAGEEVTLRLRILRFEHIYAGPDDAYVVANVRASYEGFDGRERHRELERRRATAAAVDGATDALPRVADEIIDEVLGWLREETAEQAGSAR
jgi:cholesterol transport system auxiliary component